MILLERPAEVELIRLKEGVIHLVTPVQLSYHSIDSVNDCLQQVRRAQHVIVDMINTESISTIGMEILLMFRSQLSRSATISLVNPNQSVLRALTVANFDKLFVISSHFQSSISLD